MYEWTIYLIVGGLAGLLAGLLGIGGGFVIVPALILVLPMSGVPEAIVMHVAIGTSLATICVTSISSFSAHHKRGSVNWQYFRLLTPGIVLGAIGSGLIADYLSSQWLGAIFGIGAILMAVQILLARQPSSAQEHQNKTLLFSSSAAIGCASGLVGIGGGSLVVPLMLRFGQSITRAVGTAAACGLPLAVAGAVSYAIVGWDREFSQLAIGYIYLPAFLGIILTSILTAPLGARLAHWLPAEQLKKVFAAFLLIIGIRICIKFLG
ncbi:MAG: sulfite exporter TauE/SafE family protein [Gammaproteobacteria bacterium]|nr:sulfite exporter TauE/SafE family protein [Gammaproteobacteria bacterium]